MRSAAARAALPEPLPDFRTVRVCNGALVYVNDVCAGCAPVASLSTVESVIGTVRRFPPGR
jgi:hypothetical protein